MGRPKKQEVKVEEKLEVVQEIVKEEVEEKVAEAKTTRLSGRMRSKSDYINTDNLDKKRIVPVLSVTNGTVGYDCKLSPLFLKWEQYGDEQEMSIGELLLMHAHSKMYLNDPVLLVDDEEFAETMKLTEKYQAIFETEDLGELYKGNNATLIKRKLESLPQEIRRQVLTRTVIAINNGELNSIAVIKMLKKEFDIDVEIF